MKDIFKVGDRKEFDLIVNEKDTATFESGEVHPVYATFALGRDAEWACRLFVLDIKEEDEEGIGTFLNITHVSPAFIGTNVKIIATLEKLVKNEVICSFIAKCENRIIAKGEQGQKILKKEKISTLFESIKK